MLGIGFFILFIGLVDGGLIKSGGGTPVALVEFGRVPMAPLAVTIGNTPITNESAVIITERKRTRMPFSAASAMDAPFSRSCLENSTIRIAVFAVRPISICRPSWQ